MLPVSLFLLKFNTARVPFIATKHLGMVPLKKLFERSRTSRFVRLHIDSGILP
ncbi:hypothetical protein L6164_001167 [Bauhinia variegata]|uniref:Uncharacterized protein n=1 Tax=Bauhinia variegata TaxID=167791 RepID=A0ACB9Q8Q1_BAUVA|nr:hypothetical protein L6164_001167 [Bauhinia variegata]